MKKLILNCNGMDISISGEIDVIEKCFEKILDYTKLNKVVPKLQETNTTATATPTKKQEKIAKFSREDNIKIFQYLNNYGNYSINQFEITRGGRDNPQKYIVCTVFDNDQHRYIHYNPKTEDRFVSTFTPLQAIENLNKNAEGFHLLHQVAAGIQGKSHLLEMSDLNKSKTLEDVISSSSDAMFKDYDDKNVKKTKNTKKSSKRDPF